MKKTVSSLIVVILLLATPMAVFAADPITYGETVHGSISNTIWNYYWDFNGSSGDKISITMQATSGNLDPWLTLWKQDSSGGWSFLIVDNDGGGGKDAKITYTLASGGRYVIEATRLADKSGTTSGNYALSLALLSGSSSSGSSGSSGGSGSSYAGLPMDNWDDVAPSGCPSGWHCLDSVTTRWDNLSSLTYCLASPSGMSNYIAGQTVNLWSDNPFALDVQAAINYWDNLLASFDMREVGCNSNPDFILGLVDSAALGSPDILGSSYPPNPKPGRILVSNRSDLTPGAARQINLAHELGHGLGLGHSQTEDTLMFPNHPGPGFTLGSITLGKDSMDQLSNAYSNNVSWSVQNEGFNKEVFEAKNGVAQSVTLDYPQGASHVIALCMIEGYWAKGSNYGSDADMGWSCSFVFDENDREATFTLAPSYSKDGQIRAAALVLNLDAYTLHHLYFFRAYGDNPSPICIGGAEYTDYTTTTPRYNVTPYLTYPVGSIPIIAVTRYDTWSVDEPDDDMSYGVYLENNTFNAYAWDGCGLIEGWVAVISPISSDYQAQNCWVMAGDYSPYNNSGGYPFNLPSANPSCNISIQNNWNNEVFSSLVMYNAYGDDHFSASNIVKDNGNKLTDNLWVAYGDDQSQAQFEIIGLKSIQ